MYLVGWFRRDIGLVDIRIYRDWSECTQNAIEQLCWDIKPDVMEVFDFQMNMGKTLRYAAGNWE